MAMLRSIGIQVVGEGNATDGARQIDGVWPLCEGRHLLWLSKQGHVTPKRVEGEAAGRQDMLSHLCYGPGWNYAHEIALQAPGEDAHMSGEYLPCKARLCSL